MGDNPKWQRETKYRNYINQRIYLPIIRNGIAKMVDGVRYYARADGWRRIPDERIR
jgi:hypothetical protein